MQSKKDKGTVSQTISSIREQIPISDTSPEAIEFQRIHQIVFKESPVVNESLKKLGNMYSIESLMKSYSLTNDE